MQGVNATTKEYTMWDHSVHMYLDFMFDVSHHSLSVR